MAKMSSEINIKTYFSQISINCDRICKDVYCVFVDICISFFVNLTTNTGKHSCSYLIGIFLITNLVCSIALIALLYIYYIFNKNVKHVLFDRANLLTYKQNNSK